MTTNTLPYEPMRSVLYVDLGKEEYRVKLEHFLYKTHIPESISIFEPYVSKYAFYQALPVPEGGDAFGPIRMQLTEHYWNSCPDNEKFFKHVKALAETFPPEVMKWQGVIPDTMDFPPQKMDDSQDDAADAFRQNVPAEMGMIPMVFAFLPVWWEDDFKGAGRTISDGPNYRWQIMLKYPEGSKKAGEAWFQDEFIPAFRDNDLVTRIVSSKVIKEASGCIFDRAVEIWFEGPEEWQKVIADVSKKIAKPEWAETDTFPYLKSRYSIQSIFLSDIARQNNLTQYRGYITMR